MKTSALGLALAALYVVLESAQFVFFGGLFQHIDPFLFGFVVFGISTSSLIVWTRISHPDEFRAALANPKLLIAVNLCALVTFTAYLVSVKLIEPVVTFSISSGVMPLTALIAHRLGFAASDVPRARLEKIGTAIITAGVAFLVIATLSGQVGFVRGGAGEAAMGVACAILDGVFFTLILVYSGRLNAAGVGPAAILGFRLILYLVVTGSLVALSDAGTGTLSGSQLTIAFAFGFLLLIPPLYVLQLAVRLVSTFTLSILTALGPVVILAFQAIEGRVDFAVATLIGLSLYVCGALLSSFGAYRSSREP